MAEESPEDAAWLRAARYTGFGVEFAGTIVAAILVGNYLDGRLGTAPWLMTLMAIGAMVGAVQRLIWSLKKHSSR